MRVTHKITAISVVGAALLVLGGAIGLAAVIESGEPGNAAHGVKLWAIYCDGCHNARDPKEFRDDQWRVTTTHMKVRAGLPGQDARDLLALRQQALQLRLERSELLLPGIDVGLDLLRRGASLVRLVENASVIDHGDAAGCLRRRPEWTCCHCENDDPQHRHGDDGYLVAHVFASPWYSPNRAPV